MPVLEQTTREEQIAQQLDDLPIGSRFELTGKVILFALSEERNVDDPMNPYFKSTKVEEYSGDLTIERTDTKREYRKYKVTKRGSRGVLKIDTLMPFVPVRALRDKGIRETYIHAYGGTRPSYERTNITNDVKIYLKK